jgi:hypothetical protein
VDASALIFVAVAVAWAAYLIPVAIKSHDDAVRSRSVERFSHRMRVLARREPVDRRSARLVVTPGRPASTTRVETKPRASAEPVASAPEPEPAPLTPGQVRARREAAKRATKRRRNVLAVLALANAVVITLAAVNVHSWWYVAIPAGLLAAWLVLCRVMVKGEQAALRPRASRPTASSSVPAPAPVAEDEQVVGEMTEEIAVVTDGDDTDVRIVSDVRIDPTLWDPVPVTLPTYVSKPAAARRTVRTIEIDDTGVWSSGHAPQDSQLAREAEAAEKADKAQRTDDGGRATGS